MSWVAGIFYLPRIFVHFVEARQAGEDTIRLVIMARKLVRFTAVMALLACFFGTWLWLGYGFSGQWLTAKLAFVALLIVYHVQCYRYTRRMADATLNDSSMFFRLFNESALLILIPILILVVVKPF